MSSGRGLELCSIHPTAKEPSTPVDPERPWRAVDISSPRAINLTIPATALMLSILKSGDLSFDSFSATLRQARLRSRPPSPMSPIVASWVSAKACAYPETKAPTNVASVRCAGSRQWGLPPTPTPHGNMLRKTKTPQISSHAITNNQSIARALPCQGFARRIQMVSTAHSNGKISDEATSQLRSVPRKKLLVARK